MVDGDRGLDAHADGGADDTPTPPSGAAQTSAAQDKAEPAGESSSDDSLSDDSIVQELSTLIDDGRTYAQAEIAFQKTRAKLAGRSVGIALACVIIALILLNIAFLALAVGLVIALAPLVTIWGAIAIVVGALLLLVALLGYAALKQGKTLSALFSAPPNSEDKAGST